MTSQDLLLVGTLEVEGVLTDASNLTARVVISQEEAHQAGSAESGGVADHGDPAAAKPAAGKPAAGERDSGLRGLYKPIRGEAPLRDFPSGTLGRREVAAYLISEAGGWGLIPRTVLRDGPLGVGSVQQWVDWEAAGRAPGEGLLEIFPAGPGAEPLPQGWLPVLQGEDGAGTPVVVAHQDSPDLAAMAVLDLVLNNADRKGAHLMRDVDGHLWGFDHGLTLHVEDKLRTVLWGWAGQPLNSADVGRLERLQGALADDALLGDLISAAEVAALGDRVARLLAEPHYPAVPEDRYPLPWPLW